MNTEPKSVAQLRASPRDARQSRFAMAFAQIIAILMRDRTYRNMRLADLEWLVLPPVMAGQWRFAQAPARTPAPKSGQIKQGDLLVPVAVVLWARVSPVIDKRLSENLDKPIVLKPNEWASGDNLWIVVTAGDPRAIPTFLKKLADSEFKGQSIKMRVPDGNNNFVIKTLDELIK